jgi:hypothetical protein
MILNGYCLLDGLICLLRFPLSLAVVGLAVRTWRYRSAQRDAHVDPQPNENRSYLLVLVATTLLVLNVLAWPLFYLLLQSYVPQWPGVMCIYGVLQIGAGSEGVSRFLPPLLQTLQISKPAVVFLSGAWLSLYWANRRTQTSSLMSRAVLLLLAFGILSTLDAGLEAAYLVIPKAEIFHNTGCCTTATRSASSLFTASINPGWLVAAYCAANGLMATLIEAQQRGQSQRWLPLVLTVAVVSVPINALFLIQIAAPAILHLPYHHCAYDLFSKAPETSVGIGLYALGLFAVGWACILAWIGNHEHTRTFLNQAVQRLLYIGSIGFLSSMIFFSVELVLR